MAAETLATMVYQVRGRVAHLILNRPTRGNGITFQMPRDLETCVEKANLDPAVHVLALSGNGKGFCGGYDLVISAEGNGATGDAGGAGIGGGVQDVPDGSPLDPFRQAQNHVPGNLWDPVVDYQMMSRNVRGFMALFNSDKPVITKVHGFCVAGGTDLALCSDMVVIEDTARIGYPPGRVWGTPTTAQWMERIGVQRAKRMLLTGDLISGKQAVEWGLCLESAPAHLLDIAFENLLERVAMMPINQLIMQKQVCNHLLQGGSLQTAQILSVYFDGNSRHTAEGYAFQQLSQERGFKAAVAERDGRYDEQAKRARERLEAADAAYRKAHPAKL